jgi:hypothetical protein
MLSLSIAANFDGLTPPVVGVTLPQPTVSGTQDVSLVLEASAADPQLFQDAAAGKGLRHVKIILSDGVGGRDMIRLTNALITSIQLVQGNNQQTPLVALTVEGMVGKTARSPRTSMG